MSKLGHNDKGKEELEGLPKRALGLGILALLVASWAGVVLLEWIVLAHEEL